MAKPVRVWVTGAMKEAARLISRTVFLQRDNTRWKLFSMITTRYPIGALGQIGLVCLRLQRHHHCAGNCFGRKKPDVTKNNNDQET